jgi:methionyl-tRNA formyltransferase
MSEPGLILHLSPLLIGTGQGVLKILEVQLEGKKAMPADEFVRGLSSPKILLI